MREPFVATDGRFLQDAAFPYGLHQLTLDPVADGFLCDSHPFCEIRHWWLPHKGHFIGCPVTNCHNFLGPFPTIQIAMDVFRLNQTLSRTSR
jgi:hypothetical protein